MPEEALVRVGLGDGGNVPGGGGGHDAGGGGGEIDGGDHAGGGGGDGVSGSLEVGGRIEERGGGGEGRVDGGPGLQGEGSVFGFLKCFESFLGAGGAVVGVEGDEVGDPVAEGGGKVGAEAVEVGVFALQVAGHDGGHALAVEGVVAGEGVEKDAAEGVEIGAGIEGAALELLGGHEVDGAHDRFSVGDGLDGGDVGEFGEAEVEEFEIEASAGQPVEHEVAGFDVAVEEVNLVGGDEGFEALFGDLEEVAFDEGGRG